MSNTPETDACQKLKDIIGDEYVSVEFARKLERERDKYQEQADALVDRLGQTQERMIDAERQRDEVSKAFVMAVDEMVQVQSQLREAKRELDEAREETVRTLNFMDHGFATAQKELTSVTEQRDKLAAVLQKIRDGYGGQLAAPNCCEDCDFLLPIDEALQFLTNFPQTPAK